MKSSYSEEQFNEKSKEWHSLWDVRVSKDCVVVPLKTKGKGSGEGYEVLWLRYSVDKGLQYQTEPYELGTKSKQPTTWNSFESTTLFREELWSLPMEKDSANLWEQYNDMKLCEQWSDENLFRFVRAINPKAEKAAQILYPKNDSLGFNPDKLFFLLAGNGTKSKNAQQSISWRAQFVETFGLVAKIWIDWSNTAEKVKNKKTIKGGPGASGDTHGFQNTNWEKIDDGKPMLRELCQSFKCNESTLKLFQNMPKELNNAQIISLVKNSAAILDNTPAEWKEQIAHLPLEVWDFIYYLSEINNRVDNPAVSKKLGESLNPGKDGKELEKIAALNPLAHINDLREALYNELMLPVLAQEKDGWDLDNLKLGSGNTHNTQKFLLEILLMGGVRKITAISHRHLNGLIHNAVLGLAASSEVEWGEADEQSVAPNGLYLRFLGSQAELNREGQQMQHCVASYGKRCSRRECAILSIGKWTNGQWNPVSTAEIVLKAVNNEHLVPYAKQHLGPRNGSASTAASEALEWWTSNYMRGNRSLKHGMLAINNEKESWNRQEGTNAFLTRTLGEGWNTEQAYEHRWDRWRRILNARQKTLGEWLDKMAGNPFSEPSSKFLDSLVDGCKRIEMNSTTSSNEPKIGMTK